MDEVNCISVCGLKVATNQSGSIAQTVVDHEYAIVTNSNRLNTSGQLLSE